MGFWSQFGLLMWKNWLLHKRKKCVTISELFAPLVLVLILYSMRFNAQREMHNEPTFYKDLAVNRTGTIFNSTAPEKGEIILFAPNSDLINETMDYFLTWMQKQDVNLTTLGFSTEDELLNHHKFHPANISFAVIFNVSLTATSLPTNLRYTIRPRSQDRSWRTTGIFPFIPGTEPRSSDEPPYRRSGFTLMQRVLSEAIINTINTSAQSVLNNLDIRLQRMPFPPYVNDGTIIMILKIMFPLFLMMSFFLMAIQTAKNIVYEKEKKLKESMKLMGLSAAAHWTSWFVTTFLYIAVFSGLFTLFMCLNSTGTGAVLAESNPSVLFVFLLCYGVCLICFCFMISVFTHRANIAALVCGIVFFLTYCPYFYFETVYENMTRSQKLGSSLIFNIGMAMGANVITRYESTGAGAHWSNFASPPSQGDNFSLLDAILMLLGDSAIYLLVTWYVDNCWPGEFGVPQPWYFPVTKTYWCGSSQVKPDFNGITNHEDATHFEKEPTGMNVGISVKNLRKVYGSGSGKKVAVDGMSLNMYEGQISVLLGHNGAGKTTTMSVLTGFIPASGGTAFVNGYDINTDIKSVRQSLGLCPQHNILFDTLTVQEHLEFFANLKGVPFSQRESTVRKMISEIGLVGKRYTQSQHLSGGQKRKLSVGIALIGGSKIVILDEPTSGMDPAARRQLWDILQKNRKGRTLLLTTHMMDEADLLGDRIAIMAEGVVKCCGTSYFLKKLYGAGYHLIIVKDRACRVQLLTEVVQRHIPTARIASEINAELSYLLPDDQSDKFSALFADIEQRASELGVSSFGTTATTMEEVFLKVDEVPSDKHPVQSKENGLAFSNPLVNGSSEVDDINDQSKEASHPLQKIGSYGAVSPEEHILDFNAGFKKVKGLQLELSRFRGMFVKKMLHTWRNKIITFVQLILPVAFTVVALITSNLSSSGVTEVPLKLDMSMFDGSIVPYQNGSPPIQFTLDLSKDYIDSFNTSADKPESVDLGAYNNMSDYFLHKVKSIGIKQFNEKVMIGAEFESADVVRGYYNGQPYHAEPVSLGYVMNSLLKYFTSTANSMTAINHPLPQNYSASSESNVIEGLAKGFAIGFIMIFGMAFLTSSFVHFLIKERQVGAKHLQVVSGVGPFVFWMSNLAWDFINYLLPTAAIMIVFAAFQTPAYTEDSHLGFVFLVLFLYGIAVLPFMYALQYLFKMPASGMATSLLLNIFTGMTSVLVIFLTRMFNATGASNALDWIFSLILPHHGLGMSFMNMYSNHANLKYCKEQNYQAQCETGATLPCCKGSCGDNCVSFTEDLLEVDTPGLGRYIIVMLVQAGFYFLLILAIDYKLPQMISYCCCSREEDEMGNWSREDARPEDSDVSEERLRLATVNPSSSSSDAIILRNVCKKFGNVVAVDHLNVGIAEKECFGLLGQNGAGKTTTFRMMTGDVMVSGGNAFLWTYDVRNHSKKVQENMGYCPQFDALIDQMTGRETLFMYARLRGVPEHAVASSCDKLLNILMLKQYADKRTSDYSGGNKRKLSTAIALIGDPAFIMLDEPSTGMDPKARRQLWNVLSSVRACGRTLVLTSHSMEECDALCTKIAIMVNGRFVCLGTPQHLKNKFGQGYTLIARMAMQEDGQNAYSTEPLVDFIKSTYPQSVVFDDHQGYAHFQVPDTSVSLAQVFTLMEQAKNQFNVEDYSVHQTTLEQVFLTFVKDQIAPVEPPKRKCCRRMCCCCYCCCCCC